eukprot:PhM_4_TR15175/c2_g4_i1/m.66975
MNWLESARDLRCDHAGYIATNSQRIRFSDVHVINPIRLLLTGRNVVGCHNISNPCAAISRLNGFEEVFPQTLQFLNSFVVSKTDIAVGWIALLQHTEPLHDDFATNNKALETPKNCWAFFLRPSHALESRQTQQQTVFACH